MAVRLIELDFDGRFEEHGAEKHDGYVETDEAVLSISQGAVFPMAPPIFLKSIDELLEMDTPPVYLGDCPVGVIAYRNDFLPVEHVSVYRDEDRRDRRKLEALPLVRARRQTVLKESSESSHRSRSMSAAFYFLAVALSVSMVIAVLAIMAMNWAKADIVL